MIAATGGKPSRPATTLAAYGVLNETAISTAGAVTRRRSQAKPRPIAAPTITAPTIPSTKPVKVLVTEDVGDDATLSTAANVERTRIGLMNASVVTLSTMRRGIGRRMLAATTISPCTTAATLPSVN